MKDLISVIMPVYNVEKYLSRSVKSVITQNMPDKEIILVDDGSKDSSGELADKLSLEYPEIKVVHQKNAGAAEARRTGVKNATGNYVVFLDPDDELTPGALEFLYNSIVVNGVDILYGSFIRFDKHEKKEVIHPIEEGISFDQNSYLKYLLSEKCICAIWGSISRKELWTDDVFPDKSERLPSDDLFTIIKLSKKIKKAMFFNRPVVNYYYNSSSITITGSLFSEEKFELFFNNLRNFISENGFNDEEIEKEIKIHEVQYLCFLLKKINPKNAWSQKVIRYKFDNSYPLKYRVLLKMLTFPSLCLFLVKANRYVKYLKHKYL